MSKPGLLPEPVLVGRERELEELEKFLNLAIEGKGNTVFVSGEAGAGKTRLLTEFLRNSEEKGITVLTGWCLSNAAVPYFPFVNAFDSYFSTNESEAARAANQIMSLKSWLRSNDQLNTNEKLTEITPQLWRDQAFSAVSNELLFLSAKKPIVLALEDVHWADSASISLLHYLARQVSSERILIVATFRSEELNPDVNGLPNELARVLHLMGRDELYREVALRALNVDSIGRIFESMLGGKVQPEFVEAMASDSHGNPLFVVESIRMLYQQGTIVKKNGRWSHCVENIEIPRKFREVILQRLQTLKPYQKKILEAASVIGEKFNPRLVAAVVSEDSLDVLRAIGEIEKSTLMVHCEGASYKFEHAKFRELLYNEISSPLKAEYHLRIAERIEAADRSLVEYSVNDLAFHYVQGGNKTKGIIYSLKAGNVALARFSIEEAIKHFKYVLNETETDAQHLTEKLHAMEGLGDAFQANCSFKEATKAFEDLAKVAVRSTLKVRALRKAMDSAIRFGDNTHAIELMKEAEQCVITDRLENARILLLRGKTYALQNNIKTALEEFKAASEVFEEEYSLRDTASALLELGVTNAILGMPHEGLANSLRSIALFEELGDFRSQSEACFSAGITLNNCMLPREALQMFSKVLEIEDKMKIGNYLQLINANAFSALSLMTAAAGDQEKELAGERDEELAGYRKKALAHLLRALELCKKTDSLAAHAVVLSNLMLQYTRLGNTKRAEEYFEKFMKLPPEIRNQRRGPLTLANAVFFAGRNEWAESNRYFIELFEEVKISGPITAPKWGARAQYAWALERQGRHEEALVQLEECQKIRRESEVRFEHVDVRANLIVPLCVCVDQLFTIRLDLVNVSGKKGNLVRIEDIVPNEFDALDFSPENNIINGAIELHRNSIEPFSVISIKLRVKAAREGAFRLRPKISYISDLGKNKTIVPKSVFISVKNPTKKEKGEYLSVEDGKIEFESEAAQKAFDFLLKAFIEDYARRRLPEEKSGWRTLMDLVKQGHVSQYSAYGTNNRQGIVPSELKRSGLVEARVFVGERGRGGQILKIRIASSKEIVKKRISTLI